jgi:hypothetical protein
VARLWDQALGSECIHFRSFTDILGINQTNGFFGQALGFRGEKWISCNCRQLQLMMKPKKRDALSARPEATPRAASKLRSGLAARKKPIEEIDKGSKAGHIRYNGSKSGSKPVGFPGSAQGKFGHIFYRAAGCGHQNRKT